MKTIKSLKYRIRNWLWRDAMENPVYNWKNAIIIYGTFFGIVISLFVGGVFIKWLQSW